MSMTEMDVAYWKAKVDKYRWISVKDKLPPVHFNVLVYCEDDKYHIARIDKYGCWYTVDRLGGCNPIFWMPLPEPPKE